MNLQYYEGIPVQIVPDELVTREIQVPARPHRRRRIAKKWLKRYGYKTRREQRAYLINNLGCAFLIIGVSAVAVLRRGTTSAGTDHALNPSLRPRK